MKKYIGLMSFFLLILSGVAKAETLNATNDSTVSGVSQIVIEEAKVEKNNSIDGTTSASQLRAKKSHYVSTKNETILSVSLGIISIGIIIFLLRLLGDRT
jgi:hypothetical protein